MGGIEVQDTVWIPSVFRAGPFFRRKAAMEDKYGFRLIQNKIVSSFLLSVLRSYSYPLLAHQRIANIQHPETPA